MESHCKIPKLLVGGDDGNMCVRSLGYYNNTLRQPRTHTCRIPRRLRPHERRTADREREDFRIYCIFQILFIYQAHLCKYNFSALR